jgi:ferredoxin
MGPRGRGALPTRGRRPRDRRAELLPELVTLDEWGYPVIAPGPVPPVLDRDARRAVSACPALALRLVSR